MTKTIAFLDENFWVSCMSGPRMRASTILPLLITHNPLRNIRLFGIAPKPPHARWVCTNDVIFLEVLTTRLLNECWHWKPAWHSVRYHEFTTMPELYFQQVHFRMNKSEDTSELPQVAARFHNFSLARLFCVHARPVYSGSLIGELSGFTHLSTTNSLRSPLIIKWVSHSLSSRIKNASIIGNRRGRSI